MIFYHNTVDYLAILSKQIFYYNLVTSVYIKKVGIRGEYEEKKSRYDIAVYSNFTACNLAPIRNNGFIIYGAAHIERLPLPTCCYYLTLSVPQGYQES